ncbi:helix-turn-helix domain-containing protein [Vagococcus acidifermentans]
MLRKSKGFTMKEVAGGIVSTHFLSDFERGKSDISLANFIKLLSRINLSFEEISHAHESDSFAEVEIF